MLTSKGASSVTCVTYSGTDSAVMVTATWRLGFPGTVVRLMEVGDTENTGSISGILTATSLEEAFSSPPSLIDTV